MEFLRALFTQPLSFEEFEKAVSEKGYKLADISKGEYVARGKLAEALNQNKELNERLNEANAQIEEFKGMDVDGIKKAADEWKQKAEQAARDAEARVKEMEHDNLLREKLSGLKFTSDYARQGVFSEIKSKNLPVDGGNLTGFDEVLKAIREAQPAAFEPETPQPTFSAGVTPPAGGGMKFNFTGVREKTQN